MRISPSVNSDLQKRLPRKFVPSGAAVVARETPPSETFFNNRKRSAITTFGSVKNPLGSRITDGRRDDLVTVK
ncbi:hypothetical protein CEXT_426511 [Caerostris extrusa]|uniref:Uncharacterized protein n=1 Tax=Caerostris extrusa TaxID=172846 RepID=A0AAV4Y5X4_CAEEX|nr:hypothetical protein CEXT_426511 [Caerostris extrusa]